MPRWLFPLVAFDFAGTPGAQSALLLPPTSHHPPHTHTQTHTHSSGRSWLADPGASWYFRALCFLVKGLANSSLQEPTTWSFLTSLSHKPVPLFSLLPLQNGMKLLPYTHTYTCMHTQQVLVSLPVINNYRKILIIIHDKKEIVNCLRCSVQEPTGVQPKEMEVGVWKFKRIK